MKSAVYRFCVLLFITAAIFTVNDCGGAGGKSIKGEKSVPSDGKSSKERDIEGAAGMSDFDDGARLSKKDKESAPVSKGSSKTADLKGRDGRGRRESAPSASGLKAGFVDDNKQYNYFIEFLKKYAGEAPHYAINVNERIIIRVLDSSNKPLPNATVKIWGDGSEIFTGKSYADGSVTFFPSEYGAKTSRYTLKAEYNQSVLSSEFSRDGKREMDLKMNIRRQEFTAVPLDILFIFDTTGSMGEEIARLKTTIEIIHLNLTALSSKPKVRFGMVLYKDKLDSYITKMIPFTEDLDKFRESLNEVEASGGGDYPEDLQSALQDAVTNMRWNSGGIRLAFIITDAPAHLDYGQTYNYKNAAEDARKNAIKIFSVGTGGLNLAGEYVLRQVAQYTQGKYIFLTYGEKGESEGENRGA